ALVARAFGREPAFFEQEPAPGAGLWLTLCGLLPVLCLDLGPGESRRLRPLPAYRGPVLLATGCEGSFEHESQAVTAWRVPLPQAPERALLWTAMLQDPALAQRLGRQYRHDAERIVQLGRAARYHASLHGEAVAAHHVAEAARSTAPARLGTVAELLPEPIAQDVLIVPPSLRQHLLALRHRCEGREGLADGLGASTRARYRPGVRALLVGPSGTGKTLAAGWLATQLGLPLYRVDLAAVSSKYIGETEKNLAQLFARAEHDEVVLLFDEADALFGKRTEVRESTDRFANAQTNYLLERIESFEGIALLASNSRSRFDSAFTRRLDAILEFPQPGPQERRALWLGHLGTQHGLGDHELNQLAGSCELAGGHIRNMVLAAAARARAAQRAVAYEDVLHAVAAECRKLGRQPPTGLQVGGQAVLGRQLQT
ncbi:ATP-binding protein, partial [Ramlibacter alkalitolerans]